MRPSSFCAKAALGAAFGQGPIEAPYCTGQTQLILEPEAFLRRLFAILPPPRWHLTRCHGIFSGHHRMRPKLAALLPEAPPPPVHNHATAGIEMQQDEELPIFIVERDLVEYTVLLDGESSPTGYAVLGLTTEIVEMLPVEPPALVEAVLLPWKDVIICDGLLSAHNLIIGAGMKRGLRDSYRGAKAAGIVSSLPPSSQPPAQAKPQRKAKTQPIVRLLRRKDLPKTVAEFRQRFGEPRMDMANDAAREYSTWNIDGTPALDIDYLMLYANIIKDQALYVYAKEGRITHITVVDPTTWRGRDLRPAAGVKLVR